MLRMQPFRTEFPETLTETVALMSQHQSSAKICAGGTDLVPNLKHELHAPHVIVHLTRVKELYGIRETNEELVIGAMTSLHDIAQSPIVQKHMPALSNAAAHVAGPQLRRMGTLGGNLCLDTRCLYYNQTYFWREALGFCLKKDGTVCHVTQTGKKCVAASSNDTATILLCLEAAVEIVGQGRKVIPLADFYLADGVKNTVLQAQEVLVGVKIPLPPLTKGEKTRRLQGFSKLRHRKSIDYPMLSIGVRFDVDEGLNIRDSAVVVNALAARPKVIQTDWLTGKKLDDATIAELGHYAESRCNPLTNICDDPDWRKAMISVYIGKACKKALERLAF